VIGTLGEGDTALEAHEIDAGVVERDAESHAVRTIVAAVVGFPELGFGAEEAAEHPFIADHAIDLETLARGARLELVEVIELELLKIARAFAVDELRVGIEAGAGPVRQRRGSRGQRHADVVDGLFQFLAGHGSTSGGSHPKHTVTAGHAVFPGWSG
jgi:hypothetical protein